MSDTPIFDLLRAQRLACQLGMQAAEACAAILPTIHSGVELEKLLSGYARRAADYRARLEAIDAELAAMPVAPVYAGGRKAELQQLLADYRAHQITPREFGTRMRFLMGGRHV